MSLGKFIEEKIKQAIDAGEFDNLKGAGKPLNQADYFDAPSELRAGYSILKSNNFVPEEVELLREIGILRERLKSCSETEKPAVQKIFNEKSMALQMLLERNKRKK